MDFAAFKAGVRDNFALDLNSYKETQLKRRIDNYLARQKTDYAAYFRKLLSNRDNFREFVEFLTINVSEFFRDPHLFNTLEKKILPDLLSRRRTLRIWSAACASGAEPYSLAILLEELSPGRKHLILATDIDTRIIETAKRGIYRQEMLKSVSKERLARFFKQDKDEYLIGQEIARKVEFCQHDLLKDRFGYDYDLIVCRNVVIYFTKQAQNEIFAKFSRALTPGGILFIGGSEMIFNYQELGLDKISTCFYSRGGKA